MRIWLAALLAACAPAERPLSPALQAKYDAHCATCHEVGAADAPRRDNDADWARRRARGMDVLLHRVREGTTGMPPRGLCYDCTDDDLRALATWLSGS